MGRILPLSGKIFDNSRKKLCFMYSDVVYSISYFVNEENIIFRIRFDKLQETSEDLILEKNKDNL